jgi:hypothetical protein
MAYDWLLEGIFGTPCILDGPQVVSERPRYTVQRYYHKSDILEGSLLFPLSYVQMFS